MQIAKYIYWDRFWTLRLLEIHFVVSLWGLPLIRFITRSELLLPSRDALFFLFFYRMFKYQSLILFEIIGSWDFDQVLSFSKDEHFKYGVIICVLGDDHIILVSWLYLCVILYMLMLYNYSYFLCGLLDYNMIISIRLVRLSVHIVV